MSIEQTDIIDAIGIDNTTGNIILTITDHLQWSQEHLLLLQEKLNTYLTYVESGELVTSHSDANERNIQINIVCKHTPDDDAINFLDQVRNIVEDVGMKFSYQTFNS